MKEILEFNFLSLGDFSINLIDVFVFIAILVASRLLYSMLRRIMRRLFLKRGIDSGREHAFLQIAKYFIFTVALLLALESIGVKLSLILGGAAALLVGIGLGLQQTFNDIISGLILLVEGTVEIGDIMEIDGIVGSVTSIGIRTSKINTRDSISIIIPNSKLVCDKAINWSHDISATRFQLKVGVSYGSDIVKVTSLLLQAAAEQPEILSTPKSSVHFQDFGNSSLDFALHFYTMNYLEVEGIKSRLRYQVIALFREHGIEIPFTQHDLWIRNPEDLREPVAV